MAGRGGRCYELGRGRRGDNAKMRAIVVGALLLALAQPAIAAGDAGAGAEWLKRCIACHAVGPDGGSTVGPRLDDIVGRSAARQPGYPYSAPMRAAAAAGLVWTPDNLALFLTKPNKMLPGTKMTFYGITKPEDLQNVIAHLETISPDYSPNPPPPAPPAK